MCSQSENGAARRAFNLLDVLALKFVSLGVKLDLVLVVGDMGSSMARAKEILDGLGVPWVPLLGDNGVQSGLEQHYNDIFSPQYDELALTLDNWLRAPVPVATRWQE